MRVELHGGEERGGRRIINGSVYARGKRLFLHRLVADHFLVNPDPKTKTQVGHNDYVRTNCHWKNLTHQTPSENVRHAKARYKNKPEKYRPKDVPF